MVNLSLDQWSNRRYYPGVYVRSPPDEMLVHCWFSPGIQFTSFHSYSWVEKGTVTAECLSQEYSTITPAKANNQAQTGEHKHNFKATQLFRE